MKLNNIKYLVRCLLFVILTLPGLLMFSSNVTAAEHCSDSYYVNETLPNGSRWDMCWEHRQREGIIFHHIYYTPKSGQRRMVLNHAAIAQIHVPYDDNGARYHDISDYGIGGNNMLALTQTDCPVGSLLKYSGKNVLCQQIEKRDFAYKSGSNTLKGNNLSLFSVSPVGAYYYIAMWRFMDGGTIEPWIGATGALQRFGSNPNRGWAMGDGRIGISHLHNFFWKLDFDLNTTAFNDVVEEINFPLVNGKRERITTVFNSEASRKVNPDSMRRWRVRDKTTKNENNHDISYDIVLSETGHQDIGPASEPFTHNDFYVTRQKNEEKFASHNASGGKNLAEFTNGESLVNQDIVVWAGVTFYHVPRSEDAPHMDAHWSHIKIIPRDWHAQNPLSDNIVANTPPTVTAPSTQSSTTGSVISLSIQANDVDGDTLTYSATGLPSGLAINAATGRISGTLSASSVGNYSIQISVSDGQDTSSRSFSWLVTQANSNTPPQLTSPGVQSGQVGDTVNLAIQANDSDGDSLSYSATGLPSGLSISASTGVISGTLSASGNFTVSLKVSDASSNDTKSFNWVVTATPTGAVFNEIQDSRLTFDGQLGDWSGISYFANDPDDTSGTINQIDWLKIAIAHSPQNIYFAYENRQNIDSSSSSGSYLPWGWQGFMDTDDNAATGYAIGSIGADYIIEGSSIQRYIGTGSSWAWESVGQAQTRYSNKTAEIGFPRALIGNPQNMKVIFEGKNEAFGGSGIDRYPDSGNLRYAFTGVSTPNTAPVANAQQISVGSGASVSIILTADDVDNNSLTYAVTQQPANGTLSGSAPNLVYTANTNYTGQDSFKFKANDGIVDSAQAIISVTVTPGQPGGAISNYVSNTITVNGNDSDWNGLTRFSDDANDTTGSIDWKNVAFAHNDQTLYLLYNNRGNVDPNGNTGSYLAWGWQAYIDVDNDSATGYQGGAIGADFVIEGNQILRYTGTGSNWSWENVGQAQSQYNANTAELSLPRSVIGNPASLRVYFEGDNTAYQGQGTEVDYYPDGVNDSQSGLRYFDYEFSGGNGSGDRPIAFTQIVAVTSGASANITLIATDPDNDPLTYNIAANPLHGTLTGTAPNLTYTPDADFVGQDSFLFNVNDGNSDSSTVTVTINVTGSQTGTYSNLVSSIIIDGNNEEWSGLTPFSDDGDEITGVNNIINWERAAAAHNASTIYLMYQNHGSMNPDNNSGSYLNWGWQTYIDSDENTATGYQIGNMGADYILEGPQLQRYTGTGTNWSWDTVETAILRYNTNTAEISFSRNAIGNPNRLRLVFRGDNAAYAGNNEDLYPDSQNSAQTYFEYQLSGGSQISANRPVARNQQINVRVDSTQIFSLTATDQDNDPLSYRIVNNPQHGQLVGFNETGQDISYQPDAGYTGTDSFAFVANDGTFDSSVHILSLTVGEGTSTGENDNSSGGGTLPFNWLVLIGLSSWLRFRLLNIKEK